MIARAIPLILFVAGCGNVHPHVKLDEAPDASAPYEVRAAYYKKHSMSIFDGHRMVLHDGTPIYWPEDLRPAVDPESPTAKALDRVAEAKKKLKPMENVVSGSALVAIGGAVTTMGALVPHYMNIGGDNDLLTTATFGMLTVGGVAVTGGLLTLAFAPSFFMDELREHDDAIRAVVTTYQQSLSDRVAIKANADGMLVDLNIEENVARPATAAQSL